MNNTKNIHPILLEYVKKVEEKPAVNFSDNERLESLKDLSDYISEKIEKGEKAKLIFICTHNSRRSHLSQVWASFFTYYYGLESKIECYSGGTEETAFNIRAVNALERAGFSWRATKSTNPVYQLNFGDNDKTISCFSKKYDHESNPKEKFAAVMTCSHADQNCPFVPGADFRVALPYIDPKEADGKENETVIYDERCFQIASEMNYIIKSVVKK